MAEVAGLFHSYGLTTEEMAPLLTKLSEHPKAWVDFMMRFELGLESRPQARLYSALTIAGAYIVGGLIPLSPYMVIPEPRPPSSGRRR